MPTYRRRRSDGKTQRWLRKYWSEESQRWEWEPGWHDVPDDEPETRVRPPTEGLIVIPVDDFTSDHPAVKIAGYLVKGERLGPSPADGEADAPHVVEPPQPLPPVGPAE